MFLWDNGTVPASDLKRTRRNAFPVPNESLRCSRVADCSLRKQNAERHAVQFRLWVKDFFFILVLNKMCSACMFSFSFVLAACLALLLLFDLALCQIQGMSSDL